MNQVHDECIPGVEVIPPDPGKAKRRLFPASYKLKVLLETDGLKEGELGAYLRKNGLYSSYLSTWRTQRDQGALTKLSSQPRGRKQADSGSERELAEAQRELASVKEQLRQANIVLDIQKKVLLLCEGRLPSLSGKSSSSRSVN